MEEDVHNDVTADIRRYSKTAKGRTKYRTITKETIDGRDFLVYKTYVEIKPTDTKEKIQWHARSAKLRNKYAWQNRPPIL
jgi:hypothetical protein